MSFGKEIVWLLVIVSSFVTGDLRAEETFRMWTSADGRYNTEAKLLAIQGASVVLEKAAGERVVVPFDRLSAADRDFVQKKDGIKAIPVPSTNAGGPAPQIKSGSRDEDIDRILSPPTAAEFRLVAKLGKHTGSVNAVAVSLDRSTVVTCTAIGDCRAWDLNSGRERSRFEQTLRGSSCVAVSPDGKYGLVGGAFQAVHIWDTATGKEVFTHDAPDAIVTHVRVSEDNQWVFIADASPSVRRYPLLGGKGDYWEFEGGPRSFKVVSCTPDGSYAVADGSDKQNLVIMTFQGADGAGADSVTLEAMSPMSTCIGISNRYMALSNGSSIQIQQSPGGPRTPPDDSEVFRFAKVPSQIPFWTREIGITPDGGRVMVINAVGQAEVLDTAYPSYASRIQAPFTASSCLAVASDALTVVSGHDDGTVAIWTLPAPPESVELRLARAAKTWLAQKEYGKLERLGERLLTERPTLPERYGEEPYDVLIAFLVSAYGIPEPTDPRAAQLQSWVADRPNSTLAKLAQAQRWIDVAWEGRGGGPAASVTEQGWKIFDENIEQARQLLEPIVAQEDPPPRAYALLFGVAMAQSWERDRVQPHIEKLLRLHPNYHPAHAVVAQMRMPRWGGEPEDSEAYASAIAEHIGGKPGLAIYARIAAGLRPYHSSKEFAAVTGFDYEKIMLGFDHLAEKSPTDLKAIFEAILFARMNDDKERGRIFLAKLKQHEPLWQRDLGDYLDRYTTLVNWAAEK